MAETTTTKPVNLYQLGQEIGGTPPLRAIGPDENGATTVRADVAQATLDAKVTAHVADPNVRPPTVPTAFDRRRARLDQVRAKARAILADPTGAPDWTAVERKVLLAVLTLDALADE